MNFNYSIPTFEMSETALIRQRKIWTVSALCLAVSNALNSRFNPIDVTGELSSFTRASSGHLYFSLIDASGQLRCAMFKRSASLLTFSPKEGQRVEVTGKIGVYEARGDLQLVVESMRPIGQGDLFEQYLQLKAKLEAEGLFDPATKNPLIEKPRKIGLVTSKRAAALHDVATALKRRVPHIPVIFAPSLVQGQDAVAALIQSLEWLYKQPEIDVILLVRGGGSIDDLWCFNDETLARVIVNSPVPVVTGIGHETDFTIADFCADVRAPTPTAAAEMCATSQMELMEQIDRYAQLLTDTIYKRIDVLAQRLDQIQAKLGRPSPWIHLQHRELQKNAQTLSRVTHQTCVAHQHRISILSSTAQQRVHRYLDQYKHHLNHNQEQLKLLDPRLVLQRGYTWLTNEKGESVYQMSQVSVSQTVSGTLVDGEIKMLVTDIKLSEKK
ncbi:MAG: exodeoxyribonuclease VII large subunit [Limnohabitans sp.]|nr:exodeoxyribonuclease VII large subunit [Limnohabitans sp.]